MRKNQKGQAVLIVLLSLSVVLIIVLYIMSRTVTDISLSNKDEDSMRAFSAAEAGIERALVIGSDIGDTTIGNANFSASVSNFAEGTSKVVYPISLKSGEIATFWFSRPSEASFFTGNQVKVCWGDKNTAIGALAPAVEISTYYLNSGVYKISRATLDPYNNRSPISNYFDVATSGTCTIDNEQFQFYSTITIPTSSPTLKLQFMTVKPLYNTTISHKVGIDVTGFGNAILPSQGKKINADGSSADSNRSIEVYQLHPVAPSVFMNSLFSSSGIIK
ncbi:MAG: hypothetical protein ACD_19C00176G0019 [uncultured bacterium]|nr:MAG: hypothetical protein ACD_19C00176G0019 [uncultured bacterium]